MLAQLVRYVNTSSYFFLSLILGYGVLVSVLPYSLFPIPYINDPSKLTSELYTFLMLDLGLGDTVYRCSP